MAMAKIDAQAQIAKHGANLRELLKELSKATRDQNKAHIRGKIQRETSDLCNLITDGLEQNALVGDTTGVIMGTSVFGEEVDKAARMWFDLDVAKTIESNQKAKQADPLAVPKEPRALVARKIMAAASAAGHDTGPWKRFTMMFKNGASMVLQKGKGVILWMYKGFTFAVKWVWQKITGLWNFVVAKFKAFSSWVVGFFKRNPEPVIAKQEKLIEVNDLDLVQLETASVTVLNPV